MRVSGLPILLLLLAASEARAQDVASTSATEEDAEVLSLIDEPGISSARAAAMGGALVTVADDLDAAFHNPAGIGGLNWGKSKVPWIRKLYFPWTSLSANANSKALYDEFKSEGGTGDSAIGEAIVSAHEDERQYARANLALGLVFGRTMIVPFSDMQLAATSRTDGSDQIAVRYRSLSGLGYGFSAQDPEGIFSIGYFGYSAQRKETDGDFSYQELIDKKQRSEKISTTSVKSSAIGHNAGVNWRLAKAARPTLGIALKNIGDTTFKSDDGDLTVPQDLTVGFSLSPWVGKSGLFHFVLEADRLEEDEITFTKKYRVGLELSFGGPGSYATFALRGGYNDAGGAGGLQLNVGLLALEASTYAVDIGAGNEKVIERRYVATFMVNVAEF